MDERCAASRSGSPRSAAPGARWVGSRAALVCGLGLGLVIGACTFGDIVEPPETDPTDWVPVDSVEIQPGQRLLSVIGQTFRMRAYAFAENDSLSLFAHPDSFAWSSDAPDVASVDPAGVVTALREGTAKISATAYAVTGSATVTVRDAVRVAWHVSTKSLGPIAGRGLPVATWTAIGHDGTIYMASDTWVEAVAPDGTFVWSRDMGGTEPRSAPAIGPDGTLYLALEAPDTSLVALDRTGAVRWAVTGLGSVVSSPAIAPDGTVYVASLDSTLYAFDPAGRRKWAFKAGGSFHLSSPAVAQDGTVLVGAEDGRLYAVKPDGTKAWTFDLEPEPVRPPPIRNSPVIASDGTIYFLRRPPSPEVQSSVTGVLYALTPDGRRAWALSLPIDKEARWPVALGSDGTIYVGGAGLHGVDPSGRLRWTYTSPVPRTTLDFTTPVVAGDGTIYAQSGAGLHAGLYALAPDGTLTWDHPTPAALVGVPSIGLDGAIYAALAGGSGGVYALVERGRSNGGYLSAPWPTARGNRANTGRARR